MGSESRSMVSKKRKRQSPGWKDLPSFMDASATVSVGLFGSRRLPELKSLYAEITKKRLITSLPDQALRSGGAKTSSRHLRRRTTAVDRRKHPSRFPTASRTSQSTTRKALRGKQSTLTQGHFQWQRGAVEQTETSSNIHWMVSHLWHAKRFHMKTLWGWRIPLCHSNRGARAIFRLEKENRCALQDITWKRQTVTISSSLPLSRLVPLLSRICPEFASSKAILCGSQLGSGMLQKKDRFPLDAIGPVSWHVTSYRDDEQGIHLRVEWMVHSSIFSDLRYCLKELMEDTGDTGICWENKFSSMSCFRIYGSSATKIISEALGPTQSNEKLEKYHWSWNHLSNLKLLQDDSTFSVPNGSIVRIKITLNPTEDKKCTPIDDETPNLEDHVESVQNAIMRKNLDDEMDVTRSYLVEDEVLLVWKAPRPLDCKANKAVSGWEIYCGSPKLVKAIWMKLVLHRSCCPIGMVEESHLKLDCTPPLPVFPRDFVDTEQGRHYWGGSNLEWRLVRRLWEGGQGRLPVRKDSIKLPKILWKQLINQPEATGESESARDDPVVVVARGAFIQPFINALNGCGKLKAVSEEKSSRRNRRKTRSPRETLQALPLSPQEEMAWRANCRLLTDSLSLPAVLVCHVQVDGPGIISTGSTVKVGSSTIGIVTTGSFSLTRGLCHGILIVGASRFLQVLTEFQVSSGRIVRLPNGLSTIQLAVTIKNQSSECQGTMSVVNHD